MLVRSCPFFRSLPSFPFFSTNGSRRVRVTTTGQQHNFYESVWALPPSQRFTGGGAGEHPPEGEACSKTAWEFVVAATPTSPHRSRQTREGDRVDALVFLMPRAGTGTAANRNRERGTLIYVCTGTLSGPPRRKSKKAFKRNDSNRPCLPSTHQSICLQPAVGVTLPLLGRPRLCELPLCSPRCWRASATFHRL